MSTEELKGSPPGENPAVPANSFRALAFRDWLYIPHVLGRRERAVLGFFVALAIISGSTAASLALFKLTQEAPKRGGVFREGVIRAPERVNPLFLSNNDTDRDIVALVFANLFYYDSEGNLKPDLADNYSISPDGKSYTVNLKNNALWHN